MPNLPRRLREDLATTRTYMKLAGYQREDSRWLEEHGGICPVCLQPGLPAVLGSLVLPEADMTYVPYILCQRCAPFCDPHGEQYQPEQVRLIREHILAEYPDLRADTPSVLDALPEALRVQVAGAMNRAAEAGLVVNISWLQRHRGECVHCGKVSTATLPRAVFLVGEGDSGIAYFYWACPDCEDDPDRLMERLGQEQPAPASESGNVVPFRPRKERG